MDQAQVIRAIEAHVAAYGLTEGTIGQMSVKNRHAVGRIKAGTASIDTMKRVVAWIKKDRTKREALT